jgi:predicted TIM-barrel fold metal-dependent hydrolase
VNPLMGNSALEEVRRCAVEGGARVLKLHPWLQGFSVSSPEMDAVAGLCRELQRIDSLAQHAHQVSVGEARG